MLKNLMCGIKVLCLIGFVLFGWCNYDMFVLCVVVLYQMSCQNLVVVLLGDLFSYLLGVDDISSVIEDLVINLSK